MNRRSLLRAVAASAIVTACGSSASTGGGTPTKSPSPSPAPAAAATKATVELAKGGAFAFNLRADKAPQTVARFVQKSQGGFYNGLAFHRVEDWVVQDPFGSAPQTYQRVFEGIKRRVDQLAMGLREKRENKIRAK